MKLLTTEQAAALFGMDVKRFRGHLQKGRMLGKIKNKICFKIGTELRFREDRLIEFIESKTA